MVQQKHGLEQARDMDSTHETLDLKLAGHSLTLKRAGDLESLWSEMDHECGAPDQDRIPYWSEVWPASVLLAEHLAGHGHLLRDRLCLEAGCGLGATSMLAARLGARVVALDIEWLALYFAGQSASLNRIRGIQWVNMDWRCSGLKKNVFDFIWAGDVLYETGFADPFSGFLRECLSQHGKVWIADQTRNISEKAWSVLLGRGFKAREITGRTVHWSGQKAEVRLMELTLP